MPFPAPNDSATIAELLQSSDQLSSLDDSSFLELAKKIALTKKHGIKLDLFGDEVIRRSHTGALTISQIAAICGGLRGVVRQEVFASIIALIRSYHHYAQQVWKIMALDQGFSEPVITLVVATDKNSGNYQCQAEVKLPDGTQLSTPVLGGKKKHYAKRNVCMRLLIMYLGLSMKDVSRAITTREQVSLDATGSDAESIGMGGNYKGFLFELCDAVGIPAPVFSYFPKGYPPKQIFVTEACVRTVDNIYSAKGNAYTTKRDSEHSAAKAWVSRFHKLPLFASYPLNVAMHAAQESPVTRLHDLSQKGKVFNLKYDFVELGDQHQCTVSLIYNRRKITHISTGASKKIVKHDSAQSALDSMGVE